MNPVLKAYEDSMSTDPNWTPSPEIRGKIILERVKAELRDKVRFNETPEGVNWDSLFIDEESKSVAVRTQFSDGAGAIVFQFDDRGQAVSVSGRGVEELNFKKDLETDDPAADFLRSPSPTDLPKPY